MIIIIIIIITIIIIIIMMMMIIRNFIYTAPFTTQLRSALQSQI